MLLLQLKTIETLFGNEKCKVTFGVKYIFKVMLKCDVYGWLSSLDLS